MPKSPKSEIWVANDPIGMTLGRAVTGNTCRNRYDHVRPASGAITSFTARDRGSDAGADSAAHDRSYPTRRNGTFEEVESTGAHKNSQTNRFWPSPIPEPTGKLAQIPWANYRGSFRKIREFEANNRNMPGEICKGLASRKSNSSLPSCALTLE